MPRGGIVVMGRMEIGGIATEETPADNLAGMRAQGYIDRGVSRSPTRVFDPDMDISVETTTVTTAGQEDISVYRDCVERSGEGREEDATPYSEVLLRCHSIARERMETDMIDRFQTRFEDGLRALHDGLSKPRTRKTLASVQRKIGPLRERRMP